MAGSIYAVSIASGGSNYSNETYIVVTDPYGAGAQLVPVINNGVITSVTVVNGGVNYTQPTLRVVDPFQPGSGAAFTVTLDESVNAPGCVAYYQQRRVFAGSNLNPSGLWMTRSGNHGNFDVSRPTRADDGITYQLAATQNNAIRHLVPMRDLIALTAAGAWAISGGDGGVITPASVIAKPQAYAGASHVVPLVINYDLLYVTEKGSTVRSLSYSFYSDSYVAADLTLLSPHLFYGHSIIEWAWAQEPHKIVWAVREDGMLLGLTYLKEQEVYAWHRHDTVGGQFKSVAVVSEGIEDAAYFVVQRTINGQQVQTIERMHSRLLGPGNDDVREAWFVDCGLQYRGAPATEISGLDHLEGATVSILADGSVQPQQVVRGGKITLQQPASLVTVGLPIQAQLETLPLDVQGAPTVQGKRKHVSKVRALVENTRGLKAGVVNPEKGPLLVEFKERTTEPYGAPTRLLTGQQYVHTQGTWDVEGRVMFQQDYPLPATILGVVLEFDVGT